jgi:hypothetical protein
VSAKADVDAARVEMRGSANGRAHFALAATFEGKNVPEQWHAVLRQRFRNYDFGTHGAARENVNGRLFHDHPDLQEYLVDRMVVVGTIEQIVERLASVTSDANVDGVWLGVVTEEGHEPFSVLEGLSKALHTAMDQGATPAH